MIDDLMTDDQSAIDLYIYNCLQLFYESWSEGDDWWPSEIVKWNSEITYGPKNLSLHSRMLPKKNVATKLLPCYQMATKLLPTHQIASLGLYPDMLWYQ